MPAYQPAMSAPAASTARHLNVTGTAYGLLNGWGTGLTSTIHSQARKLKPGLRPPTHTFTSAGRGRPHVTVTLKSPDQMFVSDTEVGGRRYRRDLRQCHPAAAYSLGRRTPSGSSVSHAVTIVPETSTASRHRLQRHRCTLKAGRECRAARGYRPGQRRRTVSW